MVELNLSYVKPQNQLKRDLYLSQLKSHIILKVNEMNNDEVKNFKGNHELLKFVCSCVENGLVEKYEKKKKTDKKKVVIEIFDTIFNLPDEEKLKLSDSIDFLISNKLVEKVNIAKRVGFFGFKYLKSKL